MATLEYNYQNTIILYPNNETRVLSRPIVTSKAKRRTEKLIRETTAIDPQYTKILKAYSASPIIGGEGRDSDPPSLDRSAEFEDTPKPISAPLPLYTVETMPHYIPYVDLEGERLRRMRVRPGYGLLKLKAPSFRSSAKRKINLAACAAQNEFGKERCIFLTGTLPGSTPEAMATIAAFSGYMMHRLQVWLYDNFAIDGDLYHLGVWELQDRGALHYHAMVATNEPDRLCDEFPEFWGRLLRQVAAISLVDVFARAAGGTWRDKPEYWQIYAQPVKQSVSSYLAKYLSKSAGKIGGSGHHPPSRWWACTRAMKSLVDAQTVHITLPACTQEQSREIYTLCDTHFKDADFTAELRNGYTGAIYGQVGIFNDREACEECFLLLFTHLSRLLNPNASEIELLHRMKASSLFRAIRNDIELETEAANEELLTRLGQVYDTVVFPVPR